MADFIELAPISLSDFDLPSSSPFGGGIELLMNDSSKPKGGGGGSGGGGGGNEIDRLELELNELVSGDVASSSAPAPPALTAPPPSSDDNYKTSFFSSPFSSAPSTPGGASDSHLGAGTKSAATATAKTKTWDGFAKFNNIPMNADRAPASNVPTNAEGLPLTKEELLKEKFKYLRNLESVEAKGVTLTKKYSMESSLAEMQGEYEMIVEEKSKQNSVKFQSNMLMAMINGIEFLNCRFDPFDIKLDGWSEQVNENLSDYDDVFGELHEKYKSKASLAPELKLLFQLGGSAMMVHMTNTMFKSSMPNMDDILRQNPDLMRQFQSAAVNSMGETNPGFANFVNNVASAPLSSKGPPPPMATQGPDAPPRSGFRAGNNDGGGAYNNNNNKRAEMVGPSDLSDILSGIKMKNRSENLTMNMNLNPRSFFDVEKGVGDNNNNNNNNLTSNISASDLKEMAGNMPPKSKRRTKSDRVNPTNTMSLDI